MTTELRHATYGPLGAVPDLPAESLPRTALGTRWRQQLDQLTALSIRLRELTAASVDGPEQSDLQRQIDATREAMSSTESALTSLPAPKSP